MNNFSTLSLSELAAVSGGRNRSTSPPFDTTVPEQSRKRLLEQCGPNIDAFTRARKAATADKTDTRKEIDAATAGRTLTLCAENAGFQPPPEWRYK